MGTHDEIPEWSEAWGGETLYQDEKGEVIAAIRPAPNRAVLFDSTIPHAGTPPSRAFGGLRVTIAFKLKTV
jgi:SM-20-related protein